MGETGLSVPSFIGNRHRELTEIKTPAKELRECQKKIEKWRGEFLGKRPEDSEGEIAGKGGFSRKASCFVFPRPFFPISKRML
jgi:hypothetical protein